MRNPLHAWVWLDFQVLVLLAGLGVGCAPTTQPVRGVLLITLDTTRADALGSYGGSPQVTPHLDYLARESVRFERAYTVAPLTLPAHASMLTGLLPARHTVHDNGVAVLPSAARTLAERAREAGVATAAVVSASVLDRTFGLAQGFESWQQPEVQGAAPARELSAREVFDAGTRWLARRDRERPFFLWLHVYEPHVPYSAPSAFVQQAGGNPYLAEVACADSALGAFLDPLRRDGTLDELLLLVTSDHGESLGEHGEPTHGALLYQSTVRVPLLLRFPGKRRAGEVNLAPVSLVDVGPTLADALGLSALSAGEVDGSSLWREDPPAQRGLYMESYSGWLNYGWSPLAGWLQDSTKYLHSSAPELYRLALDPGELDDLFEDSASEAQRGRQAIAEVWSRPRLELDDAAGFDAELLASLRRLGYGTTGAAPSGLPDPLAPSERPAPRARTAELMLLWEADFLGRDGQLPAAVARLRAIVGENPGNGLALDFLGVHLMQLGSFDQARTVFERRLELGAPRVDTWLNLGLCLERLDGPAAAIEALQQARAIDGGIAPVNGHLQRLLRAVGRDAEADALDAQ